MVYVHGNDADWLGVSVSLVMTKGPEALYHQSYLFEKKLDSPDWSSAKLYVFSNRNDRPPIDRPPIRFEGVLSLSREKMAPYLSEIP